MSFTDKELLAQLKGLKQFALKLTNNTSDAEDLVQSTILKVLEKRSSYIENGTLWGWCSKLMYNMFVSNYIRKSKFKCKFDPEPYLLSMVFKQEQEVITDLSLALDTVDRLTDIHKEVINLICVQDKTYDEVSILTNVPIGTVRSRLTRARNKVRELSNG